MTKALNFAIPITVACCLVVLMITGCEENSNSLNPPSVNVTGTWGLQDDLTDIHTMVLGQSGNTVTGSVSSFVGQTTAIVGFISDISITMLMSLGTSNTVNFTGTASENLMSGSWINSYTQEQGTWTAARK